MKEYRTAYLIHLGVHGLRMCDQPRELACAQESRISVGEALRRDEALRRVQSVFTGFVEARAQETRDLLDQRLRSQEGMVLVRKFLHQPAR